MIYKLTFRRRIKQSSYIGFKIFHKDVGLSQRTALQSMVAVQLLTTAEVSSSTRRYRCKISRTALSARRRPCICCFSPTLSLILSSLSLRYPNTSRVGLPVSGFDPSRRSEEAAPPSRKTFTLLLYQISSNEKINNIIYCYYTTSHIYFELLLEYLC